MKNQKQNQKRNKRVSICESCNKCPVLKGEIVEQCREYEHTKSWSAKK